MEYRDQNQFIIEIQSSISKSGRLQLLVDTGAAKTILKHKRVKGATLINTNETLTLGGAFDGTETKLGTTEHLKFGENYEKNWKFHIIKDSESIPKDGVLGADFISGNVVLDGIHHQIYCHQDTGNLIRTQ